MCQDRMHELVADEYNKAGSGDGATAAAAAAPAWKEVMEKGFARMDNEAASWAATRSGNDLACRCELQKPARCDHAGSTALVAVVGPTSVVVASAGDSRAVLSRGGVPVPLSVDHKVSLACRVAAFAACWFASCSLPYPLASSSLTGPTSWSASRQQVAASSSGTAPGCSASSPCLEPSVSTAAWLSTNNC